MDVTREIRLHIDHLRVDGDGLDPDALRQHVRSELEQLLTDRGVPFEADAQIDHLGARLRGGSGANVGRSVAASIHDALGTTRARQVGTGADSPGTAHRSGPQRPGNTHREVR